MSQEGIGGLMSMYSNPRTEGFINRLKRFPDYQPTTKLTTNLGATPDDPERLSTRINAFPRLQKFFGYVPDRFQVINFLVGEYPETFGKQEGYLLMETMSNAKLENIAADALEKKSMQTGGMAEGGLAMSDNEPMMQDRSPANQMFSIDARIENLMKSYNMLVNANEFGRAQEVADQIDQLQQQKIGIQAQNVPQMRMGGMVTPKPSVESTDTRMTSFLRKYAITPHLMDVGFFQEPSFDKWVQATRSANKAGSPIPYVSPILSDSIDALKVGYDAFIEDLNKSRQKTEPQQDQISSLLESISE